MAAYTKYEPAVQALCDKLIDCFGTTDTWKAIIHTDAPTVATDGVLGDLTQIAGSNGYTTGGEDIQNDGTRTGGTVTVTGVDVVWTASGGNLGGSTTGRYVSIYDDTSALDHLWAYWDYGSTFTVASGETLTLDLGSSIFTVQ